MNGNNVALEWNGEALELLWERALWWPRGRTLLIADPHFGKAATFRFAGIAVPESPHHDDLERLTKILAQTGGRRLVILGDFFHGKIGRTDETLGALAAWRSQHRDLEIILLPGNHDRAAGPPPASWNFQCVGETWEMGPFLCRHEPVGEHGRFVLSGHVHPSFALSERIGPGLRGRCFYFGDQLAILPAFGSFTGSQRVSAEKNTRIFLIGPDSVVEAPRMTSLAPS